MEPTSNPQNKAVTTRPSMKRFPNFGTAFAANSSAFSQLREANQTMGTDISQNIIALQKQINDMSTLMHNMSVQHAAEVNTANAAVPPVPP